MLAGCAATDDVRGDDLRIKVQASGPFEVGIPLPLDPSTSSSVWEGVLRDSFSGTTLEVRDGWVWIQGNGTGDVEGRMRRADVDADQLQRASWDGQERPVTSIPVFVEGDVQILSIHWEATTCQGADCETPRSATLCSLIFTATASDLPPGLQRIPVRTDDVQCSNL